MTSEMVERFCWEEAAKQRASLQELIQEKWDGSPMNQAILTEALSHPEWGHRQMMSFLMESLPSTPNDRLMGSRHSLVRSLIDVALTAMTPEVLSEKLKTQSGVHRVPKRSLQDALSLIEHLSAVPEVPPEPNILDQARQTTEEKQTPLAFFTKEVTESYQAPIPTGTFAGFEEFELEDILWPNSHAQKGPAESPKEDWVLDSEGQNPYREVLEKSMEAIFQDMEKGNHSPLGFRARIVFVENTPFVAVKTCKVRSGSDYWNVNGTTGSHRRLQDCGADVLVHFGGRRQTISRDFKVTYHCREYTGTVFVWLLRLEPNREIRFWNNWENGPSRKDLDEKPRILMTSEKPYLRRLN